MLKSIIQSWLAKSENGWRQFLGIPSGNLVRWLEDPKSSSPPASAVSTSSLYKDIQDEGVRNSAERAKQYVLARLHDALAKDQSVGIVIDHPHPQGSYRIAWGNINAHREVKYLRIQVPIELELENLSIQQILVGPERVRLTLKGCDVAMLRPNEGTEVVATNTHIGTLALRPKSVRHFEIHRGSVLNIECPPPGSENPFTGTVLFTGVFLPRDRRRFLLRGPQPYRNMRHHLRSLENTQMANLFHSAELAVEREDDTVANRILSRGYQCFSDFGSSALRPLVWLLAFVLASSWLIYWSDGAVLAYAATDSSYVGWQRILLGADGAGNAAKALYLALQPLVNPLGIFGVKPLLVPRQAWLAVWLTFQGLFSVVLIALMIFAIRRRFKIQ